MTRQAGDFTSEVEITPEMIAAGRKRLFEYSSDFDNEDEIVAAIYRDMTLLRADHPSAA